MNMQFTDFEQTNAPVVALHSSASNSGQWKELARELEDRFTFVAYDLPGYGKNALAAAFGENGFSQSAQPVIEEIEKLRRPVHLVGHSNGAGVAIKIAMTRPDLVKSLTVYEPAVFHFLEHGDVESRKRFAEIKMISGILTAGVASGAPELGMRRFLDFWNGNGFWAALPAAAQGKFANLAVSVLNDFARGLSECWTLDDLRQIAVPTLVMMGMESPAVAQRVATIIAKELPNGKLAILPDMGHMAPAFQPEWVNPRIADHVSANERPAVKCIWPVKKAA